MRDTRRVWSTSARDGNMRRALDALTVNEKSLTLSVVALTDLVGSRDWFWRMRMSHVVVWALDVGGEELRLRIRL